MALTYGFMWRDRNGSRCRVNGITADSLEDARESAKARYGYPGHRGGWWNWWCDDVEAVVGKWKWVQRIRER